jgi:glycosyltransferase involved in cell wall biosynthesis
MRVQSTPAFGERPLRPRVLISALRLDDRDPGRRSGNFYHALYLVKALARHNDIDLTLLADEDSYDDFRALLPPAKIIRTSLRGNVIRRDLATAAAVYRLRPDIYHKPTGALPTVPLPCRTIATIADLNFMTLPTRADRRIYKELTHRWTSRMADRIVCVSDYTRKMVLSYLHPDPERLSVIHLGANELAGPDDGMARQIHQETGSYWLAFGHHPHKNVETLLTALATNERCGGQSIRLVVVGDGAYVTQTLRPMAVGLGVSDLVRFVGRVPTGSLRALLQRSEGLLFPSLYEGFGLPLLEAMANDCPVVSSNVCSLPEVAGDAAILTDPTDVQAILAGVSRLRTSPRDAVIRRGRARARQFTWENTAAATAAIYHEMFNHAAARMAVS